MYTLTTIFLPEWEGGVWQGRHRLGWGWGDLCCIASDSIIPPVWPPAPSLHPYIINSYHTPSQPLDTGLKMGLICWEIASNCDSDICRTIYFASVCRVPPAAAEAEHCTAKLNLDILLKVIVFMLACYLWWLTMHFISKQSRILSKDLRVVT